MSELTTHGVLDFDKIAPFYYSDHPEVTHGYRTLTAALKEFEWVLRLQVDDMLSAPGNPHNPLLTSTMILKRYEGLNDE